MKVFLTGATGAIGGYAVPALLEAGHDVTAVARTEEKAIGLKERGADPVTVSLFDRDALTSVMRDHDAVINLATHIPTLGKAIRRSAWKENDRIRTEGSTALVDAALAAGVGRFVQESVTFQYADAGDAWIDEESLITPSPLTGSVATAEGNVARFTAAGRVGVVLRFGVFTAPGTYHTDLMLRAARWHVGPALGPPERYSSSIKLADGASAVVAALDLPSGVYNVVDDSPMTNRELVKAVGESVGKRPWIRFPGRLARFGGKHAELLQRSQRVSNAKLKGASGWRPTA